MRPKKNEPSSEEVATRRDAILRRALSMPSKPLEKFVGKSSLGKPLKTDRQSSPKSRVRKRDRAERRDSPNR